jgi:hypothetical protein
MPANLARRSALALAGAVGFVRSGQSARPNGLAMRLAEISGLPGPEIFENLPSRTGFLPGTFLNPDGSLLDVGTVEDDQAARTGLSTSAELDTESFSPPERFWIWPFVGRFRDRLTVTAGITDGALHVAGRETYSRHLEDSRSAQDLLARGLEPLLIDRAWRAQITLDIGRRSGVDDEAWAEVIRAVQADADAAEQKGAFDRQEHDSIDPAPEPDDASFRLTLGKRVTCAYSVVKLSRGGKTFLAVRGRTESSALPTYAAVKEPPSASIRPWTLATVSSGWYSEMATMNQPWNAISAKVAAAALRSYHPVASSELVATRERPLAKELTLAYARQVAKDAKSRRGHLIVFYYIGHMVTYEDNSLALLMGDAGRTRLPAAQSDGLAKMGGNLADLSRMMSAIQRKAQPPKGELELSSLYQALASGGLPFILLVDGCMQAAAFAEFRERLGLVIGPDQENELFVGQGSATDALRQFTDGLVHFADRQPYLSSANPVVLGAAPGTVANPLRNPVWQWGAPVGPLANYIATTVERSKLWQDRPSLARLLNWSAETARVGETNLKGTMSWSDWLPLLSAKTSTG